MRRSKSPRLEPRSAAHIDGQLTRIIDQLDRVAEDNRSTRATVWGVGLGLAGLILASFGLLTALLAYSGDRFAAGMDVGAIADAAAERAVQQAYPWNNLQIPQTEPPPAD